VEGRQRVVVNDEGLAPLPQLPAPVASVGGVPLNPWDHVCVLHRGEAEREHILLPYLRDGLRAGHTCLCITAEGRGEELTSMVTTDDVDVRLLQVFEPKRADLRAGCSPEGVLDLLHAWSSRTFGGRQRGFARVAGDMSWVLPVLSPRLLRDLVELESQVTSWLREFPQVAMCLYDLDRLGGEVVVPMIKTHPKVWASGMVVENPC
jgi:hypothetical protein